MTNRTGYAEVIFRSQLILIAITIVALVVGVVLSSHAVGSDLIAIGSMGIGGGGLGLVLAAFLYNGGRVSTGIWFSALFTIGMIALIAFLILRPSRDAADIGFGFLLIFAVVVGLPGLFGTAAWLYVVRRDGDARAL